MVQMENPKESRNLPARHSALYHRHTLPDHLRRLSTVWLYYEECHAMHDALCKVLDPVGGPTAVPTITMAYVSYCTFAVNFDTLLLAKSLKNVVAF
jgi:hypothetical protein